MREYSFVYAVVDGYIYKCVFSLPMFLGGMWHIRCTEGFVLRSRCIATSSYGFPVGVACSLHYLHFSPASVPDSRVN